MSPGTTDPNQTPPGWASADGTVTFPPNAVFETLATLLECSTEAGGVDFPTANATQIGGWDAGSKLAESVTAAQKAVSTIFPQFLQDLQAAANALRSSGRNYGMSEDANVEAVRKLWAQLKPVALPPPPPPMHFSHRPDPGE